VHTVKLLAHGKGGVSRSVDARNTAVHSEFILDICSGIYEFFLFQTCLDVGDLIVLSFLYACTSSFSLRALKINSGPYLTYNLLSWKMTHHAPCKAASSGDGDTFCPLQ
jgi:hypothetical protein